MNRLMRPLSEWLKPLFERFLAFGTEAAARENAARFASDVLKAQGELGEEAVRQLNAAESLGIDGNPHKARVSELLSAGIADTVEVYRNVTAFKLSPEEGRAALASNPTSGSSEPSGLPSSEGPKALEGNHLTTTNGAPGQPLKRPRGRPRKNPLPSPERDDQA